MESATITLLQTIIKMLSEKVSRPEYANVAELCRLMFGKTSQANRQKIHSIINRHSIPHYMPRISGGPYYKINEVEAAIKSTKWEAT